METSLLRGMFIYSVIRAFIVRDAHLLCIVPVIDGDIFLRGKGCYIFIFFITYSIV